MNRFKARNRVNARHQRRRAVQETYATMSAHQETGQPSTPMLPSFALNDVGIAMDNPRQPTPQAHSQECAGFQHPEIENVAMSKLSSDDAAENEKIKQYLHLVIVINNKTIHAHMCNPATVDKNLIISDKSHYQTAAECLARHFSGIFIRHLGIDQMITWSKADIAPPQYFAIIKPVLDAQAVQADFADVMAIAPTPELPATPSPAPPKFDDPYAVTAEICDEINEVEPLRMEINAFVPDSSFITPEVRDQAIKELYVTARQSNIQLRRELGEVAFPRQLVIDFVLYTEMYYLNSAAMELSNWSFGIEPNVRVHQKVQAYYDGIAHSKAQLEDAKTMQRRLLVWKGEKAEKEAAKNAKKQRDEERAAYDKAAEESRKWKQAQAEMEAAKREQKRKNVEALLKKRETRRLKELEEAAKDGLVGRDTQMTE